MIARIYGSLGVYLAGPNDLDTTPAKPASGDLPQTKQLAGWAIQFGLWACVGAILYGAGTWGLGQLGGNPQAAGKGKAYVIGGIVGAAVLGLAVPVVSGMLTATQSG